MATPVNNIYPRDTSTSSAHSLQAFTELVYVQAANDLLYGSLQSLQNALSTTAQTVDVLTEVQGLHNAVRTIPKGSFTSATGFSYSTGYVNYSEVYISAASSFFGTPVDIGFDFSNFASAGADVDLKVQDWATRFLAAKTEIMNVIIPSLSATTPRLSNGAEDPNSLLVAMRKVLNDMPNITFDVDGAHGLGGSTFANMLLWIRDNYAEKNSPSTGAIQLRITRAITAAESLNTQQTASVRNYLNLYEEYYKSASAVLQQITQIIQTMAQNISRG